MEQIIISGATASGLIGALPGLGVIIKSVEIDLPLDEVGTSDPVLTLSGSATGAYSFHSDTTLELTFVKGEDIYITSADFGTSYSAVIRYLRYGEQNCYMMLNNPATVIPVPNRFK